MSNKKQERRSVVGCELRTGESQGDELSLVARALTYNALSEPGVPYAGARERIAPGTFTASLKRGDEVMACVNHDVNQILGRTRNNTLLLADDVSSLRFTVRLNPDVQAHLDLHALVKDATLSECSFAFIVEDDEWSNEIDEGGRYQLRTVKRAKLMDVSIVAAPAYGNGATAAQARHYLFPSNSDPWAAERQRLYLSMEDAKLRDRLHEITMEIIADKAAGKL